MDKRVKRHVHFWWLSILGIAACAPALCPCACGAPSAQTQTNAYPQIVLANGILTATVYLPDAQKGYYRGVRFDWSGLIRSVQYGDHSFFGEWKQPHNPADHDGVVGPAEEYGMQIPLGYDEAKPGDVFYKIGVGGLQRPDGVDYQFYRAYKLVQPAVWRIRHGANWVEFHQNLKGERGWAYRYVKRIELDKGAASLTITHVLENTGTKPIQTDQYCHNFTIIDGMHVGPAYSLRFTFALSLRPGADLKGVVRISGGEIDFTREIAEGQALYAEFPGVPPYPSSNRILITNTRSGGTLHVSGDRPPVDFHFYAVPSAVCPEPFIALRLAPGQSATWHTHYDFGRSQTKSAK